MSVTLKTLEGDIVLTELQGRILRDLVDRPDECPKARYERLNISENDGARALFFLYFLGVLTITDNDGERDDTKRPATP